MNASVLIEFERDSEIGDNLHMWAIDNIWYCDVNNMIGGFRVDIIDGDSLMLEDGIPLASMMDDIFRNNNVQIQDVEVIFNSLNN